MKSNSTIEVLYELRSISLPLYFSCRTMDPVDLLLTKAKEESRKKASKSIGVADISYGNVIYDLFEFNECPLSTYFA